MNQTVFFRGVVPLIALAIVAALVFTGKLDTQYLAIVLAWLAPSPMHSLTVGGKDV